MLSLVVVFFLLFASAISVKEHAAEVRSGCEPGDSVVATVAAGSAAEIRFAISGSCYKVVVKTAAGAVEGYLPASALSGLNSFEKEIAAAPAVGGAKVQSSASPARMPAAPANGLSDHPLARANTLIDQNQPRAALEVLEQSLKTNGRDYRMIVAAGVAAYRADEPRIALEYLTEAQTYQQDRSVQQLISRIQKEKSGDKSGEKLYGTRFLLRYEGGTLAPEVARTMIALLENEFSRISAEIGCRTDERIVTVVQSKQAYRESTDAAEWSGGLFDGSKIRIPVVESTQVDGQTRRVLAHELVHACLASMGSWPMWLHEGVAQKLSGEALPSRSSAQIKSLLKAGKLPRLDNMNGSWSRMSTQHAQTAYAYALTAAELLFDVYRNYGIQNIFRNPDRLPHITADLDKRLSE